MNAAWTAAHLRKQLPYFCSGGVGKEVFLKAAPIAKKEIRGALINDVSGEEVECTFDITKAFGVDQAIFALSGGAVRLMQ